MRWKGGKGRMRGKKRIGEGSNGKKARESRRGRERDAGRREGRRKQVRKVKEARQRRGSGEGRKKNWGEKKEEGDKCVGEGSKADRKGKTGREENASKDRGGKARRV